MDGLVLVGFGHASLVDSLRPDVAYPTRKVRRAKSAVTEILASPCDCADAHVEVWARPIPRPG